MEFAVNGDVVYTYHQYMDKYGDVVEIGVMVGFLEEFTNPDADTWCKSYIVLDLPNLGDMVEITQIEFLNESGNYTVIDPNQTLLVEPWKIGLI
jgi:hypothetical protein